MLHHQPLIWTLTHHEKQQTYLHNLQTTKHKKNKKEEEKRSSSDVHDPQPFPCGIFWQSHPAQ